MRECLRHRRNKLVMPGCDLNLNTQCEPICPRLGGKVDPCLCLASNLSRGLVYLRPSHHLD